MSPITTKTERYRNKPCWRQEMNCKSCGHPLIEVSINKDYCLYLCDNSSCLLFRERQGVRKKEPEPDPTSGFKPDRRLLPSYYPYLEQKKHNYHFLRNLGIRSSDAARMTSNKQTRFAAEMAGFPSP